jgi:dihydrofolate synthase/folylpolyglutamate synthase
MDYAETLQYLYNKLPMFTRIGAAAYKNNLDNTVELCKRLGDPQHQFKSVHVAGTNGKGSTSHMLAAILQTAGYKTGLYTSPHLVDFRERVRINGGMISRQQVIDFVQSHKTDFEDINPSFFEMTVGLAFDIFAREKVDIAIIEVGLGGRLDSTNIITPLLSLITNIGWDHMNILGNTLQLIAAEKAGIIKHNIPVVIGEYQPEVADIFLRKAAQEQADISFASDEWEIGLQGDELQVESCELQGKSLDFLEVQVTSKPSHTTYNLQPTTKKTTHNSKLTTTLQLDLTGTYQLKNVKTVLSAAERLRLSGYTITDGHLQTALRQVKTLTGLHGRWEVLSRSPLTICDTGHNPGGISEVLKNIAAINYKHLHFVIGMVNDKDIGKILALLPATATYYFCQPNIPRGLEAKSLKQQAESFGLHGAVYPSVKTALQAAQKAAKKNDLVFVGGSTFVVAEVV